MGCFDKGSAGAGSTNKVDPRNPEDKPYEWFLSPEGLEVFDETMQIQNFNNDEVYEEEQKKHDVKYFSVYIHVYHKEHKSPRLYFEALVSALAKLEGASDALEYVWPIECVAGALGLQARPCYFDDNGDPIPVEPKPEGRIINDIQHNSVLQYAKQFNVYSFAREDLDWKEMAHLWHDALFFVLRETSVHGMDYDVLGNNPWILDPSTYLTQMGTLRSEKGFYSTGVEKSTNPEYCKEQLERLD